jgi:hypothetical protein
MMVATLNSGKTSPQDIHPAYRLKTHRHRSSDLEIEVWQLSANSSQRASDGRRVAGLKGRNFQLIEHRVLRRLDAVGVKLLDTSPGSDSEYDVDEDTALHLGLLFRLLAPMRSRDNMRQCAEGVEGMPVEEAAYWLGMAMHRRNPRRVLMALRALLIDPRR